MPDPHDTGEPINISRLRGQESRPPVTAVERGRAAVADNTYHDSSTLRRARGTKKLVSAPIPGSCYEVRGRDTGIFWPVNPPVPAFDWNGDNTVKSVICGFGARFLELGSLISTDGNPSQVVFASHDRNAYFQPAVGTDSVWIRLQNDPNFAGILRPSFRVMWANRVVAIFDPDDQGSETFDFDAWWWFTVQFERTAGPDETTLTFSGYQWDGSAIISFTYTDTAAGDIPWRFDHLRIGGRVTRGTPNYGIEEPCPMLLTEVKLAPAATLVNPISATTGNWTREVSTVPATLEVWPMSGEGAEPVGTGGTIGYMVSNSAHRSATVVGKSARSLFYDGTGTVWLSDAAHLREPPRAGGVNLHYLERDELSIMQWFKAHRPFPFLNDELEGGTRRACIHCWTTPHARNIGVPDDAVVEDRPSEHLRVELVYESPNWYLDFYFGELDPNSLQHPTGTIGGSTVETWPPGFSTNLDPPPTWNLPIIMPGLTTGASLRIDLGADGDPTHPMDYDWVFFAERKFVAQGDAGNAISAWAYQMLNGVLIETGGPTSDGEFYDDTGGLPSIGRKTPLNQSCFTAVNFEVFALNPTPDTYAYSLGAACPGMYSDEKGVDLSLGNNWASVPGLRPSPGAAQGFFATEGLESFGFIGHMAHFAAFKKYLDQPDRFYLARAGALGIGEKKRFEGDLLYALDMTESGGSILRERSGRDSAYEGSQIAVVDLATAPGPAGRKVPDFIGLFPRPHPTWHNEATQFVNEASPVTGIVQRIDETGTEEIFATALPGLYEYNRTTHALSRILTLPGQGGPNLSSFAIDDNDVIHIAGNKGRPVIITRARTIALSGILAPVYGAPESLITQPTSIAGGMGVSFASKGATDNSKLTMYGITNGDSMLFAIGYWSEILNTRSAPGPVVAVQYTDPASITQTSGTQKVYKYRVTLTGTLPVPVGFNAALVTHWEIFRSKPNNSEMFLEQRIPIGPDTPATSIGWLPEFRLGEEARHFNAAPPEGLRFIAMMGPRMYGARSENEPRLLAHSVLNDPTNWPPTYRKTTNQTPQPVAGLRTRRDRIFVCSRDYLYEVMDQLVDTQPDGRIPSPVQLRPTAALIGIVNHHAIAENVHDGLFLPGNQGVFTTEGGVTRSVTHAVNANGAAGDSWKYPDMFDLSKPGEWVSFHDDCQNVIGIIAPSSDDPNRRDALLIFYEHVEYTADGRAYTSPEVSRMTGLGATCVAEIIDPASGSREVWIGDDMGYLKLLGGAGVSLGVDYDWLATVSPKCGQIMAVLAGDQLRLEGTFIGYPADLFKGAHLRCINAAGTVLCNTRITSATTKTSWIDVTTEENHGASAGDHWAVGSQRMEWLSGQDDFAAGLIEKRVMSLDVRFRESVS